MFLNLSAKTPFLGFLGYPRLPRPVLELWWRRSFFTEFFREDASVTSHFGWVRVIISLSVCLSFGHHSNIFWLRALHHTSLLVGLSVSWSSLIKLAHFGCVNLTLFARWSVCLTDFITFWLRASFLPFFFVSQIFIVVNVLAAWAWLF